MPSGGKAFGASGYLYVVADEDRGRVKIGITSDPQRRLGQLVREFRRPLRLHSQSWHADVAEVEADAHLAFVQSRIEGEWFDLRDPHLAEWLGERGAGHFRETVAGRPPERRFSRLNIV